MKQYEQIIPSPLQRTTSCQIIPASHRRSISSISLELSDQLQYRPNVRRGFPAFHRLNKTGSVLTAFLRSILSIFIGPAIHPSCQWLIIPAAFSITPSLGRKVTGTLFGNRRGFVSFAVQDGPRSVPALIVELPLTTADLVREMASGLLRIALECEKAWHPAPAARVRLFREPVWTMYCNGRQCGHALARSCKESDWNLLSTIQSVSSGAGVIPVVDDGRMGDCAPEGVLLYMRARFERVVGNRDSVALYMLNPDGSGVPEFSVFLLRI